MALSVWFSCITKMPATNNYEETIENPKWWSIPSNNCLQKYQYHERQRQDWLCDAKVIHQVNTIPDFGLNLIQEVGNALKNITSRNFKTHI